MTPIDLLEKIIVMVKPLNPPVEAFENSARRTPFKTLISVLLSARTKDEVTHIASNRLFEAADTPAKMNLLDEKKIAELIFPVGFYHTKAKHIKQITEILSKRKDTSIPDTFEELLELPGVGRKTANLVLSIAFTKPSIAVDIHVFRISQRLGWASGKKPEEIEKQLRNLFPSEYWTRINQSLVGFGQTLCKPVNPSCHLCSITDECLYYKTTDSEKNKLKQVSKAGKNTGNKPGKK